MNDVIVSNSNIEDASIKSDAIKVLTAERLRELLDYDAKKAFAKAKAVAHVFQPTSRGASL